MATGQTMLNLMEVLNNELQLQPGEADVVRGLMALNAAQDQFEARLARFPRAYPIGLPYLDIATAAATGTQTISQPFKRIDRIQPIDAEGGTAAGPDLHNLGYVTMASQVQQANDTYFTLGLGTSQAGKPVSYWSNGRLIQWFPIPDAIYNFRVWGLRMQSDLTASGTFTYDDDVMLPFASFATRLLMTGIGDESNALQTLASELFDPVISAMFKNIKDRNPGFDYSQYHTE